MHRTLRVDQAADFDTVYPLNVQHRAYPAVSATAAEVSWIVDSPGTQLLLDSEAYVIWTVNIQDPGAAGTLARAFEGFNVAATPVGAGDFGILPAPTSGNTNRFALRQGFCLNNALEHVELRINHEYNSVRPGQWNGELTRFFATPEELNTICSLSGGELDDGNFSNRVPSDFDVQTLNSDTGAVAAAAELNIGIAEEYEQPVDLVGAPANSTTLNPRRSTPLTGEFHNPGFATRWRRMAMELRVAGAAFNAAPANNVSRYADNVTLEIAERVPIDPFMQWERKDGRKRIPGVRRLELRYKFSSNALNLILQGRNVTGGELEIDYHRIKPTLRLKWIVPPHTVPVPFPVTIPYTYMDELTLPGASILHAGAAAVSPTVQVAAHQIKLRAIPSLLLIYLKPRRGTAALQDPTEQHLEITNLRLSYTTAKGSLVSASSQELFTMYVRNSPVSNIRPFKYEKWRRRYCTVALRPEDHGIQYTDPGGVILDLDLSVRSHWNFPAVGRDITYSFDATETVYELKVLAMYAWGLTMSDTDSRIQPLHA